MPSISSLAVASAERLAIARIEGPAIASVSSRSMPSISSLAMTRVERLAIARIEGPAMTSISSFAITGIGRLAIAGVEIGRTAGVSLTCRGVQQCIMRSLDLNKLSLCSFFVAAIPVRMPFQSQLLVTFSDLLRTRSSLEPQNSIMISHDSTRRVRL